MNVDLPSFGELTIVSSEHVEDGIVFVVDMSTVEWEPSTIELKWQPGPVDSPSLLFVHTRITGKERVVETNPLYWSRPRSLRGTLRRIRAIIGYSYRKAAGKLRCYESINALKLEGFSS